MKIPGRRAARHRRVDAFRGEQRHDLTHTRHPPDDDPAPYPPRPTVSISAGRRTAGHRRVDPLRGEQHDLPARSVGGAGNLQGGPLQASEQNKGIGGKS